jgi:hypothetical protein
MDALVLWSQSATTFLSGILARGDASTLTQYLPQLPIITLPLTGITIDIGGILSQVITNGGPGVSSLWSEIIAPIISVGAQTTQLIAVDLLRATIRMLARVELGWDIAIWANLRLEIVLPWLERLLDHIQGYIWQLEPPSVGDAVECYLQHTTEDGVIRCWMAMHSASLDAYRPIIDARRDKLSPPELLQYLRRHDASDDDMAAALQLQGWTRATEAAARVELFDELPTISDHLHWLQRNVFDDAYVADFQLLDGFDDRFWVKFGHDLRALGMRKDYAALHYAAHWVNPAPGQLQEMVYRLRPDKPGVANPFTLADYQRILVEQDVGAYFRPRFAEIAYRIPALGYIRDMFRAGIVSQAELKSYHQDLGYTEADSQHFADVDELQRRRMRASAAHGWTPQAMAHAYVSAALTAEEVTGNMMFLGWTEEESRDLMRRADAEFTYLTFIRARSRALMSIVTNVKASIRIGITTDEDAKSMLESAGWPSVFAGALVASERAGAVAERIKHAVGRVRSAFDSGEVGDAYVTQSLQMLGITGDNISSYIAMWRLELTPGRRRRSASQIVTDVADAVMPVEEALVRLTNLGYSDADSQLYLADVRRKLVAREAKARAAEERVIGKRAKALIHAAKEADAQRQHLVKELMRDEPASKLEKWAELGLITKAHFYERLELYGFELEAINLRWEQSCAKKNAACDGGPAHPPSPARVPRGSGTADGGTGGAAGAVPGDGGGPPAVPGAPPSGV